jgi:hypothetical protein
MSDGWRYFGTREVTLARIWAAGGGIAVHENLFRLGGRRTAHLLAPDESRLLAAARLVGCAAHWIQRTRTIHFDLVGIHLERALIRCGRDPSWPAVRAAWPDLTARPR